MSAWRVSMLDSGDTTTPILQGRHPISPAFHARLLDHDAGDVEVQCTTDLVDIASQEPTQDAKVGTSAQDVWTLVHFAFPVVLTSILEYLPDIVCIVLVGRIKSPKSTHYVDAAALSTMFTNMTALFVGFGLSTALDTLCAQAHGAGKTDKLGIYLQTSMLVVALCMIPIFALNWFCGDILRWTGQNAEVAKLAGEYTRLTIIGIPGFCLYEMNRKVLQAQNITMPPVFIAVLGTIVTIVVGYFLTFKTSLGFHGAPIAFTLNNFVMALSYVPYYACSKRFRVWWHGWNLKKARKNIKPFLRLGIPGMLGMILDYSALEIIGVLAGVLPDSVVSLGAQAVLVQVINVLFMIYYAIGIAGNIHVGAALGANKPFKARRMSRITLTLMLLLSCALGVMVFFLREFIARALIMDPVAIHRAAECLVILIPYVVISGLNCAIQGVFLGIGKQHLSAVANFVAMYVIGLPLGVLLAFQVDLNLEGLWIGFTIGILAFVITCLVILARSSWEKLAHEAQQRVEE